MRPTDKKRSCLPAIEGTVSRSVAAGDARSRRRLHSKLGHALLKAAPELRGETDALAQARTEKAAADRRRAQEEQEQSDLRAYGTAAVWRVEQPYRWESRTSLLAIGDVLAPEDKFAGGRWAKVVGQCSSMTTLNRFSKGDTHSACSALREANPAEIAAEQERRRQALVAMRSEGLGVTGASEPDKASMPVVG